ncbi:MAG TPA: YdeI/OmpD-associated family protein [Verrucomicrobiae bacterium]|nr:YdeI/OmpD-associated family protein [Verrucomicrobiae bacterium]
MPKKDPRVDAYIARAGEFARPILNRIRKLVHAACPDVQETMKWRVPFFAHKGNLITMPAFKRHCALIFWKGRLFLNEDQKTKLRRLTSISELPGDKTLTGYIKKAIELNEAGIKIPRPKPKPKKPVVVPDYFLTALKQNKKALAAFADFSPSHKREYVEWITEAKREETRAKRIQAAVKLMAKGKSRNWKYE